jgi:hypothetical protein
VTFLKWIIALSLTIFFACSNVPSASYAYAESASKVVPTQTSAEPISGFSSQSEFSLMARSVGQLIVFTPSPGGGTESNGICTVIAISKYYIITARHCLEDSAGGPLIYTSALVAFDYPSTVTDRSYDLLSEPVFRGDKDLDIVLMRTRNPMEFFYTKFRSARPPQSKEDLYILQYLGDTLVLTRAGCRASKVPTDGIYLHHDCFSEPGSSGAPIFDQNDRLIGVHVRGRNDDSLAGSFSSGILLSAMSNQSTAVKWTIEHSGTASSTAAPLASITTQYDFDGGSFIERADQWVYRSSDETESEANSLVKIKDDGLEYTFWNSSRDLFFRFPRTGGELESKPGNGDNPWTDIDPVDQVQ